MGDDRLCHAAHDQPREPGPSVGPDYDQVRLPLVCGVDDRCSRISLANLCFDGQPRRRNPLARLPCELLGILRLTLSNLFERRRSEDDLSGWRRVGLNHRHNAETAWSGPRTMRHFPDGVLRRCRSVNRQEDLHSVSPRRVAL